MTVVSLILLTWAVVLWSSGQKYTRKIAFSHVAVSVSVLTLTGVVLTYGPVVVHRVRSLF